jgi:hypothetical protein
MAWLVVLGSLAGCGGGGPSPGPSPSPAPTDPTPSSNACASVSQEAPTAGRLDVESPDKRSAFSGDQGWTTLDFLWTRQVVSRARGEREVVQPRDRDAGDIAILEDNGRLIAPPNTFDLRERGLRFRLNPRGGYDVSAIDAAFRPNLGTRLSLQDDDSSAVSVPFPLLFFGRPETVAFVNSDGNLTFGSGDSASTPRNISRFLAGPPRLAVFFADLDPSVAGSVWASAAPDAFTVTWCNVPGFDSAQTTTVQATLLPDGTVEVRYDRSITLTDAVVGLSPGQTTSFLAADLTSSPSTSGPEAIGERFSGTAELDLIETARRFLASRSDTFDQIIVWTDQRVVSNAFAFELTVRNDIRGIGVAQFDDSRTYGSLGRLSSMVLMDALIKYPDDPERRFLGENSTLGLLGHESGHRWLASLRFRDADRRVSDALLGRDLAHWSFFFDSDGSVMEGNDIQDEGGGAFRTVDAVSRYSRLDQYAMGLAGAFEVPPAFYVESPVNTRPDISGREAAPRTGVTFNGTRRDVRIDDIIDVVGPRVPGVAAAPKVWRQAFVYVVGGGRSADPGQIAKLDRIRQAWEPFYERAVDGRGRVQTQLQ